LPDADAISGDIELHGDPSVILADAAVGNDARESWLPAPSVG
jgi:hypothetical protein